MLRPLPKIDDAEAMLARGVASALRSARNDACEALRGVFVAVQSAQMDELADKAQQLRLIAQRLDELETMWGQK
jgi:hypothetical protein